MKLFKALRELIYGGNGELLGAHTQEYSQPTCTYCGGTKFYQGPSGGISTNILCANKDCRHRFNWHSGIIPMDDLHRVEPTADEAATARAAIKAISDAEFTKRLNEGRDAYRASSLAELRMAQRAQGWTHPKQEHIDQLCGYIEAMAAKLRDLKNG